MSKLTINYESKQPLNLTITEDDEHLHRTLSLSLQIHSTGDSCSSLTIIRGSTVEELPGTALGKRPHSAQCPPLSPHLPKRTRSYQRPAEEDDAATIPNITLPESPVTALSYPPFYGRLRPIERRFRHLSQPGNPQLTPLGTAVPVDILYEHTEIDNSTHAQVRKQDQLSDFEPRNPTRESVEPPKTSELRALGSGWARKRAREADEATRTVSDFKIKEEP
ncbi:hypothetical protein BDD12DRAFT_1510 [Trichophaea hybrida]|nr:hypothetical protein BDD12DRAFT_1510 [Trichophaea hybrida]